MGSCHDGLTSTEDHEQASEDTCMRKSLFYTELFSAIYFLSRCVYE
jgi:hypothetical protein